MFLFLHKWIQISLGNTSPNCRIKGTMSSLLQICVDHCISVQNTAIILSSHLNQSVFKPIHAWIEERVGSKQGAKHRISATPTCNSLLILFKTKPWKKSVQQRSGWILSSPVRPHRSLSQPSLDPVYWCVNLPEDIPRIGPLLFSKHIKNVTKSSPST